jgi:hypothetical protein
MASIKIMYSVPAGTLFFDDTANKVSKEENFLGKHEVGKKPDSDTYL